MPKGGLMNPEKTPLHVPLRNRTAPQMPAQFKPEVPPEVLGKYQSGVPLRRPAVLPGPTQEPLPLTALEAEQAIAAAKQGNTIDVPPDGRDFTVRVVPAVREAMEASGLSGDKMKRFLDRLANVVGSREAVVQLPTVTEYPRPELVRLAARGQQLDHFLR
jgi:hypothetical protein